MNNLRPCIENRTFHSSTIDKYINDLIPAIKDKKLCWMFQNCFPNTLDTTVKYFSNKADSLKTFIITGDINAMWIRDSAAQIWSYLPFVKNDVKLCNLIKGLISKQVDCLLIDPYANAFNNYPTGSYWETDHTQKMAKELHERKWELDSPCYFIRLSYNYWKMTGDSSIFTKSWNQVVHKIVDVFKEQQRKNDLGSYSFMRDGDRPTDSQMNNGYGAPIRPVGLIYSAFRPSDDATQYGFLIPSNMFAVVSLKQLTDIYKNILKDKEFSDVCLQLADEVDSAIKKYGVVKHPKYGKVFAYEVDGFGNALFMDEANVPNLMSAPYIGYCSKDNKIYQRTRKLIWSEDNPYFFSGKVGHGIGGPHVGLNYVWPMSIIMRALTSNNVNEIKECITQLVNTDNETGYMHESFNCNDASDYTRPWFAWANTLFGELISKINNTHTEILNQQFKK